MTFAVAGFDHQNLSVFYRLVSESQHVPHHVSVVYLQRSGRSNERAHAQACVFVFACIFVRTFFDINKTLPSSNLYINN